MRQFLKPRLLLIPPAVRNALSVILLASASFQVVPAPSPPKQALDAFTTNALLQHIQILASDRFEGRAPGSTGEELTVQYLEEQFRQLDLQPGNPDGTFIQHVPLVGIRSTVEIDLFKGSTRKHLETPRDFIASSQRPNPEIEVASNELVFVGYGVVAPEYNWDDFKDVDVRGKTVVMLVNDPPLPDPAAPSRLDPRQFKGNAMTYYGRWTYKYEIASRKGAAAALVIHETGPAGYPFFVLVNSLSGENFSLKNDSHEGNPLAVAGWLSIEGARTTFAEAGQDFDQLKRAALRRDFRPVNLGLRASFKVRNTTREVQSRNVIARINGSHSTRRDEFIVYTAHWDHIGRNDQLEGDQIFNGAKDNASGVAGLLELARAFKRLPTPPRRSILFLAVTAEEQGLLGARHYAQHPLYPVQKTLANINMDGLNQWGRTRDIVIIGEGSNTLEDLLRQGARRVGRVAKPDPEPEKGFYYRSDQFEFAKIGVPALYLDEGIDYIGRPLEYGMAKRDEYTSRDYHKASDEIKPDWDLSGAVDDLRLLFEVGWRAAQARNWPEWKPGSEFRALREQSLRSTPSTP